MSRYFHGLIFMGAGDRSINQCDHLHERLENGLSHLSGAQQMAFESEELRRVAEQNVEDVVRDVAAALLGREVTFGDKLPYPPKPRNGVEKVNE